MRTKKKLQRKDGHVIRFDDNACVLINKNGEPVGTRLTGEWSRFLVTVLEKSSERCSEDGEQRNNEGGKVIEEKSWWGTETRHGESERGRMVRGIR